MRNTKKVRCRACEDQPVSAKKHCLNCSGSTWVEEENFCNHAGAKGEAMTGGWLCSFCGESGPTLPPMWFSQQPYAAPPPNTLGFVT